jgi:putative SOS response-associated peptidase YedK
MCGRVFIPGEWSEIKIRLRPSDFAPAPNWQPRWNVAPTEDVLVLRFDPKRGRVIDKMRWSLIPAWAKDPKLKFPSFNARSETIAKVGVFKDAWNAGRRAVVVTGGFYEWQKIGTRRQPYAIARANEPDTLLGAVWEEWTSPADERIKTVSIMTTAANELIAPLHDRMPVVIGLEDLPKWIGEEPATREQIARMLRPFPSDRMRLWPVSEAVNSVKNDRPDLIDPIPEATDLFGDLA